MRPCSQRRGDRFKDAWDRVVELGKVRAETFEQHRWNGIVVGEEFRATLPGGKVMGPDAANECVVLINVEWHRDLQLAGSGQPRLADACPQHRS